MPQNGTAMSWLAITVGALACLTGSFLTGVGCQRRPALDPPRSASTEAPVSASSLHRVEFRPPPRSQGVLSAAQDGQPVALQCGSCHGIRPPNGANAGGDDMNEFHQGLQMSHGRLTCVSCHNPADSYTSLRLADGRALPRGESMTLCAQCHGTQYRDYLHGAHGGMSGHWDLSRGGRMRNHCLHCHDAHSPKYPTFMPAAGPRDRFPPVTSGATHD